MRARAARSPRRSRYLSLGSRAGSILIVTLWVLSLLSVFAVVLSYGVRQKLALSNRLEERSRARYAQEGAAYTALYELMNAEEGKTYDWLGDSWSNSPFTFKDKRIGDATCTVCYTYLDKAADTSKKRYGLIDEERKINVNKTDRHTLQRLLELGLGFEEMDAQNISSAIVDWRDGDSALSIPAGSAEDADYRNGEFPYEAKDADFDVPDELLLVKGVTPEVYEKINEYVTVYGSGRVNINTAPRPVLLALGLGREMVSRIEEFRAGKDGIHGNGDDEIFEVPGMIAPVIKDAFNLADSQVAALTAAADLFLSTESTAFTGRCYAVLNDKEHPYEATFVINKRGKILYWSAQ